MKIQAVFFDLDGTLVDSNVQHVAAWHEAFVQHGVDVSRASIRQQIGKGADMLIPALVPEIEEAPRKAVADAHDKIFQSRYLHGIKPFADARALLEQVKQRGKKVVLASSAKQSDLDHYIDLLDTRQIVSATASADDVGKSKPAPDIFAVAMKRAGPLTEKQIIVVGDTPYDIEASAKCGIASIGILSGGFAADELLQAGAAACYADVAELLDRFDDSLLNQ